MEKCRACSTEHGITTERANVRLTRNPRSMHPSTRAAFVLCATMLSTLVGAQCPLGPVTLTTQAQVYSFAANYPNCTALSGSLTINGPDITDLSPFNNLSTVGGDLWIWQCPLLTSINGFIALDTVGMNLNIWQNNALATVNGFQDLEVCGNTLLISENPSLTSIGGFSDLDSIGGGLVFSFDPLLTDISGFDHAIEITVYLEFVSNPLLSPCNVQAICDHVLDPANASIFIQGNASGCASLPEVIASCISTAVADLPATALTIHPNPTSGTLFVGGAVDPRTPVVVTDGLGRTVARRSLSGSSLDLAALSPGAYVLEVRVDERPARIRFVRE